LDIEGFSCYFLNLTMRQSPQGISYDIFGERFELEYTSVDMIHMPHVQSYISIAIKLGFISNQFYKFWGFVFLKISLFLRWLVLLSFWKVKATF
jgi:hypothetical protein